MGDVSSVAVGVWRTWSLAFDVNVTSPTSRSRSNIKYVICIMIYIKVKKKKKNYTKHQHRRIASGVYMAFGLYCNIQRPKLPSAT